MREEQRGFYLLDYLAAVLLTSVVGLTVLSVMIHTMATRKQLQDQTKQYEAIRVPAQMIMQDARMAKGISSGGRTLCLYNVTPDGSELVDNPDAGITYWICDDGVRYYNPNKKSVLYRQVMKGGVVQSEEAVADGLDWQRLGFDVLAGQLVTNARVHLIALPLRGQAKGAELEFEIYTRDQE